MITRIPLGQLVMTTSIRDTIRKNESFDLFVRESLHKYMNGDWGTIGEEDKYYNELAASNDEQVIGVYKYNGIDVMIITEGDRSVTTVLFPIER